jgi:REP element-mobilizing transposase RayT
MTGPAPEQFGRRSIRMKGYDYSQAGGYYVTIVSYGREYLFGEVLDSEMRVNELGRILQEEWFRSARIRKEIRLFEEEFVVMPNHIHGIVWIDMDTVGADGVRPDVNTGANDGGAHPAGASHAPLHRKPKSLGSFIAGFKASVTSRAGHELNSGNIWQRNFYEHILRDQADYERIAGYILDNPLNWEQDEENPQNSAVWSDRG